MQATGATVVPTATTTANTAFADGPARFTALVIPTALTAVISLLFGTGGTSPAIGGALIGIALYVGEVTTMTAETSCKN